MRQGADQGRELVHFLLPAQIRRYNGGVEEASLPWVQGATVADYVARLAIPAHEFMGVVLDGTLTGDLARVPGPGSRLELVPALSGG